MNYLNILLIYFSLFLIISADKECKCGPYSYNVGTTKIPITSYTEGIDYTGNDMDPCGKDGCKMSANSTNLDCKQKCQITDGCIGYIWAQPSCQGDLHGICWLKNNMSNRDENTCRNFEIIKEVIDQAIPCPLTT